MKPSLEQCEKLAKAIKERKQFNEFKKKEDIRAVERRRINRVRRLTK